MESKAASKLPVVLLQKLSIGKKIFADGKEVGISVYEEHCSTPKLFVFSSDMNINNSLNKKQTSGLKK
ncbi:UNVERIFIED_CONTAM: hypothetical protein RMT77_018035 [Armadillidium vulgare]